MLRGEPFCADVKGVRVKGGLQAVAAAAIEMMALPTLPHAGKGRRQ